VTLPARLDDPDDPDDQGRAEDPAQQALDPTATAPADWRRYYTLPQDQAAEPSLERPDPSHGAVRSPVPAGPRTQEDETPEDRSLRELFWGED
jgi:hypothetical protein